MSTAKPKKPHVLPVRLADTDKQMVVDLSAKFHISQSEVLRLALVSLGSQVEEAAVRSAQVAGVVRTEMTETCEAYNKLSLRMQRTGNRVDQIAKRLHQLGDKPTAQTVHALRSEITELRSDLAATMTRLTDWQEVNPWR